MGKEKYVNWSTADHSLNFLLFLSICISHLRYLGHLHIFGFCPWFFLFSRTALSAFVSGSFANDDFKPTDSTTVTFGVKEGDFYRRGKIEKIRKNVLSFKTVIRDEGSASLSGKAFLLLVTSFMIVLIG